MQQVTCNHSRMLHAKWLDCLKNIQVGLNMAPTVKDLVWYVSHRVSLSGRRERASVHHLVTDPWTEDLRHRRKVKRRGMYVNKNVNCSMQCGSLGAWCVKFSSVTLGPYYIFVFARQVPRGRQRGRDAAEVYFKTMWASICHRLHNRQKESRASCDASDFGFFQCSICMMHQFIFVVHPLKRDDHHLPHS
ncbi:uncharacterized protein F5891DRAFT_212 [Suillus fuscotomentosus]|uniref:Uncharacterized protein n=1 Tax=Suillus fuscotomentosus TaxID=1912939 RepID=A0AAD4HT89_9AGAM|nr:uncharacterized protein F5891DRAFT_212 [Suillus fuscotomentosus]KAG1908113.1 hypothetical protein F5891DRAFT_212 [Suillus fuscotomentosus]